MSSANVQTAHTLLSGFATMSADTLVSARAESCMHYFLPSTLKIGPQANEAFRTHIGGLAKVIKTWPVTPYETLEDTVQRKVVVFCRGRPEFQPEAKDEGGDWDYESEYVFAFEFDEAGRVVRIVEWLNSANTEQLRGLVARAKENIRLRAET